MSYNTATFSIYGVRAFDILAHHEKVAAVPLRYKLASILLQQRGVLLDNVVIQHEIQVCNQYLCGSSPTDIPHPVLSDTSQLFRAGDC
jgi:hypothetical protein